MVRPEGLAKTRRVFFMRTTHTFVLRLLVNSAEPEALRGDLRPLPEGEAQPFPDEQALLALLHRLTGGTEEPPGTGTSETTLEHRITPGGET